MHSSRVGVSTSACTSFTDGSTYSIIGRPKAAVLPEPVWAWPMTSRPSSIGGMACSWMGLGRPYPTSWRASSVCADSPGSAKGVTEGEEDAARRSAGHVERHPGGGPPPGEDDLRLAGVGEGGGDRK